MKKPKQNRRRQPDARLSFELLEVRQMLAADCGTGTPDGAAAVAAASQAQAPVETIAPAPTETQEIALPSDLPEQFAAAVEFGGETLTLSLQRHSVFGENTRFLVDNGSGELTEVELGEERTYLGVVEEDRGFGVTAILSERGLTATILRPGLPTLLIEPDLNGEPGEHLVFEQQATEWDPLAHDHDGDGVADHAPGQHDNYTGGGHPPGCTCANCCAASEPEIAALTPDAIVPAEPLPADQVITGPPPANATAPSTATLAPTRVLDVYEFEVGVEIGSAAFLNNYDGDLGFAQSVAQGIAANLDARFLHATGIKHRIGTVIIRTSAAEDQFSVANGNDRNGLNAFRDYWNNNPQEVGDTHDLAVYHVRSSPSGLAFVGTAGTSSGYALSASNGPTSWADNTLVHEFGHSWNLGHINSPGVFYENRPRSNNGATTAGGIDIIISPMANGSQSDIGRFSTDEALRVLARRDLRLGAGDLVADPGPIKPFGHRDSATVAGGTVVLDVAANDYDVNNDVLDVEVLDTVSFAGGTIGLSVGTGPGGRNEIVYTPAPGFTGRDFFHYTVVDSTGRTDFGAVEVQVNLPVDAAYQFDFGIDANPAYNGVDSPAGLSVENATWNLVTPTAPNVVNALDSEGQTSPVSLRLRETSDGGVFDFGAAASGLEGRDANYDGFYSTDLLSNLMFTRGGDDLGVQLEGLPSGVYNVLTIIREPSAANREYSVDIGTGIGDTARFGDFGEGNLLDTPGSPSDWVEGQNFVRETINVFEGESVFVLIDSLDSEFVSLQGLQLTRIGDVDPPPRNAFQIDFGPTGNGVTNSSIGPAGLPANFSTWNGYDRNTNVLTGVVDARGDAASSIQVRVRETADGQGFDFAADASGLEDRDANYTGFYSPDLLTDLMFTRGGDDLGVEVEGLPGGVYEVYTLIREPSAPNREYSVDIGSGAGDTPRFGDFGQGNLIDTPGAPSEWVEGQNYARETVTLSTGESLFVLIDSLDSEFVSLQGIQIVQLSIDEPVLPGDYNQDNVVSIADYTAWRDQFGQSVIPFTGGDGNGDGTVDLGDYDVWLGNLGQVFTPPTPSEPSLPAATVSPTTVSPTAVSRATVGPIEAPAQPATFAAHVSEEATEQTTVEIDPVAPLSTPRFVGALSVADSSGLDATAGEFAAAVQDRALLLVAESPNGSLGVEELELAIDPEGEETTDEVLDEVLANLLQPAV